MAEPTTVIGEFTSIQGNLHGDEDLQVFGRVEGTIQLERTLSVEPSGVVKADVVVRNAVVSGIVVGNIQASESVRIEADGRMVGDIAAPRVIIVEGAMFRGRVDMGEAQPARGATEAREPEKPAPAFPRPQAAATRPAARPAPTAPPRAPAPRPEPVRAREPEPAEAPRRPAPTPRPAPRVEPPPPPPAATEEEEDVEEEAEEEEAAERTGAEPPPPKPRVAPRKRRVSIRKK